MKVNGVTVDMDKVRSVVKSLPTLTTKVGLKKIHFPNIDSEMFVIPNKLGTVESMCRHNSYMQDRLSAIAHVNKLQLSDDDQLVDLWIVIPGITDNLADHGFDTDKGHYCCGSTVVPQRLIDGIREGDSINLSFPVRRYNETMWSTLTLNVRAMQNEYRYRGFGRFEDVVAQVCD